MGGSVGIWIAVASSSLVGLVAYAAYRWRQRRRVRLVEEGVRAYLSGRYGEVPAVLHIDCSDDRLWPVLVDFIGPRTGALHRLRFACPGAGPPLALLPETGVEESETRR